MKWTNTLLPQVIGVSKSLRYWVGKNKKFESCHIHTAGYSVKIMHLEWPKTSDHLGQQLQPKDQKDPLGVVDHAVRYGQLRAMT